MINLFPSKKKEHVAQIGGAMGEFDEEFEQSLEDKPKGPQILGSITFNMPDFAPMVSEVVNSFYGLKEDFFGKAVAPATEEPPQAEKEAIFVRDRARALQEQMQRLTIDKQNDLMRDALRMGVNIIDVQIEVQEHTNPIQIQREHGRMKELGISDIASVAIKAEARNDQVEEAEKDRSMQAAAQTSAIANANEGGSGQVGSGGTANLSFQAAG